MRTDFRLAHGVSRRVLAEAWTAFLSGMVERKLAVGAGRMQARIADTPLDTDAERGHGFSVTMHFHDRPQADRGYAFLLEPDPSADRQHRLLWRMMRDPVFTCWEDLPVETTGANSCNPRQGLTP